MTYLFYFEGQSEGEQLLKDFKRCILSLAKLIVAIVEISKLVVSAIDILLGQFTVAAVAPFFPTIQQIHNITN